MNDKKEKKEINVTIGENLKRERERAGLTQEKLSEMIGMGPKNLSSIERGAVGVSLTTLRKICTTLQISSDSLFFGRDSENDVSILTERLAHMSPEQFEIANAMLCNLLRAFALNENHKGEDTE